MIGKCMGLVLLLTGLSLAGVQEPEELVRRLGSNQFQERESAARALETLGRRALPALADARNASDPEIQARASALATSIQKRLLIEPTRVDLNFEDRPIAEVVNALSTQSGMAILLLPENQPAWQTTKITLRESEPVPFWQAVDRVTEATRTIVQPSPGGGFPGSGSAMGSLRLVQGQDADQPVSDDGPFRCTLISLHHHRDLTFPRAPMPGRESGRPVQINDQFYFNLQLTAEPRLLINQTGQLRILEAIDDRGRSLVPTDMNVDPGRGNAFLGMASPMAGLQIQANLLPPADGKAQLRRLRGVIPLAVASPKPEPLVIRLDEAVGKSFRSDDASITVDALNLKADQQPRSIELTLKSNREDLDAEDPFSLIGPRAHFALPFRFELRNAQGNTLRLTPSRSQTLDGQTVQLTLVLSPVIGPSEPAELRFFDLVTATADVTFEFSDIPLP